MTHVVKGQMQSRSIPFGRAVRVFWRDSRSLPGWQYEPDRLGASAKIVSQGYVAQGKRGTDALVLTTSIGTNGAVLDPVEIPWSAIAQMEFLPEQFDRQNP